MADLKATVIDATGSKTGTTDLPKELFGGEVNVPLLHQVVEAQRAGIRAGSASTKTRSEVRGGGTKPWRQKGTGRARHGSIRSPIWVGGGTVFGPKPRSYSKKVPKKMKAAALRSALADKAVSSKIWILDGALEPKTKLAAACLAGAGIEGRVLVVVHAGDEVTTDVHRAFRNLSRSVFCYDRSLNTHDVLLADAVLFTKAAFEALAGRVRDREEAKA